MNFVNLPVYILFFAVVYLISIYGLLTIAQMFKSGNIISRNKEKANNKVEIS